MAGHNDDGSAKQKTEADLPTNNVENLKSNMKTIYYSRTFFSIIAGVIAGIMGFTSLTGFIFYFIVMAFTWLALVVKANFNVHSYFDGWNQALFDGFLSWLMSYVLFWTRKIFSGEGAALSIKPELGHLIKVVAAIFSTMFGIIFGA